MINYIYNQMFYLQELGILLGGWLTCEELVGHQIEHLAINEANYFLY